MQALPSISAINPVIQQHSTTILLQLLKHYLLHSLFSKHLQQHPYVFLSLLTPFTIYQSVNHPNRIYIHILLLTVLNYPHRIASWISLGALVFVQPTFVLLVVPLLFSKEITNTKHHIEFSLLTALVLHVGCYLWGIDVWKRYLEIYYPTHYQPRFNLIWFLFSHLFLDYQLLFSILFFLIPPLFILPLRIIFRNTCTDPKLLLIIFNFCLFIILYTSTQTTIYDIYFYHLLIIPGYWFYKQVPVSITFLIGVVVFGVIGSVFMNDWRQSFTTGISYVFYMIMTCYTFMVIFQVEVFNTLTDSKLESLQNTETGKKEPSGEEKQY